MRKLILFVDDDEISNLFNERLALEIFPEAMVKSFENANDAILFLSENKMHLVRSGVTIFLDLRMPEIDGYDFMSELEDLELENQLELDVKILSGDVCKRTLEKKDRFPLISEIFQKPLTKAHLYPILNGSKLDDSKWDNSKLDESKPAEIVL